MSQVNNPKSYRVKKASATAPPPPHRAKKADRAPPPTRKKKCRMFKKGRCPKGDMCPFAHAKMGGNRRTRRRRRRRHKSRKKNTADDIVNRIEEISLPIFNKVFENNTIKKFYSIICLHY